MMQLDHPTTTTRHTTPVIGTGAFDVSLAPLLSVSTDIFHHIEIAQLEKLLFLMCASCLVWNKGLVQSCLLSAE